MTPLIDPELLPQTRIHPIDLIKNYPAAKIWLKREDEAGYAIAGGKKRKFASLIPWLKEKGYVQVAAVGGSNSNNLLAAMQLLREQGLGVRIFRKEIRNWNHGNGFLTHLLESPSHTQVIDSTMQDVWLAASRWARAQGKEGKQTYLLPEGSNCAPALPGAMTLAHDIQRNEKTHGLKFDHIFIDAGTGFSAFALGMALAEADHQALLHVVLMAGDEFLFLWSREHCLKWYRESGGMADIDLKLRFECHWPDTARKFGKVNDRVLKAIRYYAEEFGVLTDPVYSAKLFLTAQAVIRRDNLKGNILLVHSGGAQSLPGFAEKLIPPDQSL